MKTPRRAFSRCRSPGGIPKLHLPSPQGNFEKIKKIFFQKKAEFQLQIVTFTFDPRIHCRPCPGFLFHIILIYNLLLVYRGE